MPINPWWHQTLHIHSTQQNHTVLSRSVPPPLFHHNTSNVKPWFLFECGANSSLTNKISFPRPKTLVRTQCLTNTTLTQHPPRHAHEEHDHNKSIILEVTEHFHVSIFICSAWAGCGVQSFNLGPVVIVVVVTVGVVGWERIHRHI